MGLPLKRMTLAEFLDWESTQPEKYEFYAGELFMMVGGRRGNAQVVSNLVRHLGNQLQGSACRVLAESMMVQIGDDTVLYPDVLVACDAGYKASDLTVQTPRLIIEVLSPSTQAYDRSQKFALYRRLNSLQEYILIDPETRRIEAFRRNADNQWVLYDMSQDEAMLAPCIAARVTLAEVFDGVDPAP